jgi:hypothetical protein
VSEKPILFSAPMVRAIIDGRKTQTRRVAKNIISEHPPCALKPCPYGQPGDKLWVRETWRPMSFGFNQIHGPVVRVQFAADMAMPVMPATEAQYDATHPDRSGLWRPSIHMPRWASRITLEVTAVRVERLQEITEADAIAEGCEGGNHQTLAVEDMTDPQEQFLDLWDSINAERGYGWSVNPFVWVVSFKLQEARNDR